ncbi:hypothetical protein BJ138DRAFT_1107775 [Hygrophoropsis aurantiaca]|uniref:Uncharacterized protein n=1 Tax=Hygrophoropsis aurantiaca TaxID=72124 RepID=A0ACB7ZRD0_9AGAM|nr:hypothetical protein BJ138DRAFT_1107775 [Hygrophoropsis aurantiaca]
MPYDAVQKMLAKVSREAGLSENHSSHCLRRGGTKYRFMEAPLGERWSLTIVRWWGGWAEREGVDTLIRYLLDDLTQYEKGHGDALCPVPRQANQSFNGDHILTNPTTGAESRELKLSMDRKLDSLVVVVAEEVSATFSRALHQFSLPPSEPPSCGSSRTSAYFPASSPPIIAATSSPPPLPTTALSSQSSHQSHSAPPLPVLLGRIQSTSRQTASPQLAPAPPSPSLAAMQAERDPRLNGSHAKVLPPLAGVYITDLPKGSDGWCRAVQQWETPSAGTSYISLKDWPVEWYTGKVMKVKTASKQRLRQVIADEFVTR